jgi:murein DD-endopeptidase MepM/ murein hydrolase activator NlpD
MIFRIFSLLIVIAAMALPASSLPKPSKKGGFLFPIKPGQPASLTGNMGEIRSNHFHGGLDIRTGWASGLPVLAAKDGFISRVIMAGEGYGNTIFLSHPDGFVTLYAHLEKLAEPLHSAVKKKQYELKSFEVDLSFKPGQFEFRQGEVIAISGNTGSSRGPHLHFEIRDTSGMVYNPLSFGFSEVVDKLPPVVDRLALVPLETPARVEARFDRLELPVREAGKDFMALRRTEISGTVGLEIKARDRINNGTSNGGIFCIEMYRDGKLIYYHNLSQFPFSRSNHVNQLINYRNFRLTSEKFQKLYYPDGYFQTKNIPEAQHGKIRLSPGENADIEIVLWDVNGNKRSCRLSLVGAAPSAAIALMGKPASRLQHEVLDNTLQMRCNGDPAGNLLDLFVKGKKTQLSPAYREEGNLVFLHDLRNGLPDSVRAGEKCSKKFFFAGSFFPGQSHAVSLPGLGLTLKESCLFDTLFLEAERDEKGICRLNTSLTPLADFMTMSLPSAASASQDKQLVCAEALSGVFTKALPTENRSGNLYFTSKYLGRFQIQADSIPPVIKPAVCNSSQARFDVYDQLSGIASIEASINGDWVLMVYDKKRHLLYSEPWPSQLPMRGDFVLKVRDKSGNTRVYSKKI